MVDAETAIKIFAKERTNPLMLIRVIFEPKKGDEIVHVIYV